MESQMDNVAYLPPGFKKPSTLLLDKSRSTVDLDNGAD